MMITIGACISFTVGRIIVGHLTKQDFPYLNFPLFIPIIQAVLMKSMTSIFNVEYNDALQIVIYGGLGASISIYAMFISEIIYDITDYLDIWALTIKYPKDLKNK